MTVNQYYGFLFAVIFILSVPVFWLKELETNTPPHTFAHFREELWITMQSRTTLSLLGSLPNPNPNPNSNPNLLAYSNFNLNPNLNSLPVEFT